MSRAAAAAVVIEVPEGAAREVRGVAAGAREVRGVAAPAREGEAPPIGGEEGAVEGEEAAARGTREDTQGKEIMLPNTGSLFLNVGEIPYRYLLRISFADPDPGSGIRYLFDPWIRDPGCEKVGIRIRDPG